MPNRRRSKPGRVAGLPGDGLGRPPGQRGRRRRPPGVGLQDETPAVRFRKWLPTSGVGEAGVKAGHKLPLVPVEGAYAVSRLDAHAPLPGWVAGGPFVSITRTADELSVVCREEAIPEGVRCERGWRCLRVAGTLAFSLVGVLASLVGPLADAGVSKVVGQIMPTGNDPDPAANVVLADFSYFRPGTAEGGG